jgi:hypothetical protein
MTTTLSLLLIFSDSRENVCLFYEELSLENAATCLKMQLMENDSIKDNTNKIEIYITFSINLHAQISILRCEKKIQNVHKVSQK